MNKAFSEGVGPHLLKASGSEECLALLSNQREI